MYHFHTTADGRIVKFCGYVCEKTKKPVKPDDIKDCYKKPVGIE